MFALLHQYTQLTAAAASTPETNVFATDQGPEQWPNIVTYMTSTPTFSVTVIFKILSESMMNYDGIQSLTNACSVSRRLAATP